MKLLIVESPSKSKTISKYLGDGYVVRASVGHVRDLPKSNKKAVDIEAGFVPHYEVVAKKEAVLADIAAEAAKASEIILATDPDREGEAIAWHIAEVLKDRLGKDIAKKMKRVTYHEITKEAVLSALEHPRDIDEHLREAQEARRVLDRIVGYDLSGLIWKKVRYGLSAGRVQSPALRIIMEREREIRAFKPEDYWVIAGEWKTPKNESVKLSCVDEPRDKAVVDFILEKARKGFWHVLDVEESEQKRSPRAPFITSTLQQAASSRYGFSPSRTMGIAQKLYESGYITYMRTDSTNLSKQALDQIEGVIVKNFGKQYFEARTFSAKSKNAQEAHEAIRPSVVSKKSAGHNDEQKKLYELIWQRTVASQMTDARIARTKIVANINGNHDAQDALSSTDGGKDAQGAEKDARTCGPSEGEGAGGAARARADTGPRDVSAPGASNNDNLSVIALDAMRSGSSIPNFTATGSRVVFDGWLKADPEAVGDDVRLPVCAAGDALQLIAIDSEAKQTQPPARYTEAGLIKELEKRGIGRPSTYASITKTIEDRGYVAKENKSLKPTDTGDVVSSFLEENFPSYISDSFTAEMEDKLDDIAAGTRRYTETLKEFYGPFHKDVKSKDKIAKITNLGEADAKFICPKCGGRMEIKLGKNGKFLSCIRYPDCDGALTIDGMEFKKDEPIGVDPVTNLPIFVLNGRFGPYVQLGMKLDKAKKIKKTKKKSSSTEASKDKNVKVVVDASDSNSNAISNADVKSASEITNSKTEESVNQLSAPKAVKPRMASIPKSVDPSKITIADAMKYLSMPKKLGLNPATGKEVTAGVGRFGPYVVEDGNFRSVKAPESIYDVTLVRALELLAQPKKPRGFTKKVK